MINGKWTAMALLVATLALGTPKAVLAQAQGSAGTGNAPAAGDSNGGAAAADAGGLSDGEKQAVGCAAFSGIALAGTYAAGPTEATLLLGGGLLVPSSNLLLMMSLLGQIGAASCAIGAVATPTILWFYDQSDNIAAKVVAASDQVGQRVMQASAATGATVLSALGVGASGSRQVAQGAAVEGQ
jgi:hypothetical protein